MIALAHLQQRLQASVLGGDAAMATAEIVATPVAGSERRLGIYLHAYRARLFEVLGNDFPGLRALAGADEFERLCHACIEAVPSAHFNVRWYGSALAGFIRTHTPWSAAPALAAMAQVEWKLGLAFDAADEPFVDAAAAGAIAAAEWPCLRLRLHGSLQREQLAWNVSALRRSLDHDEAIPPLREWRPARHWIAWREGVTVHHRCMDEDEAAALAAVERGSTFAQVCERLCEWHPRGRVAPRAAALLRRWIDDQWISALQPSPAE